MSATATKTKPANTGSEPCYIMLVAPLVNGIILPGFNNAEIYPGERVSVRGDNGINFEHAVKLLATGRWVWCDENGTPIEVGSEPEPTDDELAIIRKTGADVYGAGVTYPDYHRTDDAYSGPPELPGPEATPEQPSIMDIPGVGRTLNVVRSGTPRRDNQSEGNGPATVTATGPVSAFGDDVSTLTAEATPPPSPAPLTPTPAATAGTPSVTPAADKTEKPETKAEGK